ncbi:MAG: CRP-like cAMP-activated global transcriptional regulator [Rhodocyclaceae bacterium]|nr:MAG: Crp/Fnr family transcriptional regulator [Rhodocyclaceae bacterium]MBV6407808.1 CRP-like cAMP-activated global transcriptional regulator [Rhodocyclaceae bacterium]CAG0941314.1 CRP-like cAMP-activated global transcriptional regulator [Gammaproteobacteria bacterium]
MKPNAIEALPPPLLERLAAGTAARPYPRNAIIVTEGDESDCLFVLLSGRAKVYISDEDGREIELNRIGPGEYFGEVALDGGPRSASVMALEDCRCAVIRHAGLTAFLAEQPEFALHMIRKLAHRVRALTENVRSLAWIDVYGRVARLLLELAEEKDGALVIDDCPTQKDIAQRIGASREMVNRILADLADGGYIRKDRSRIVIARRLPAHW